MWKIQYTPPPKQCDAPGVKALRLDHMQGLFIILAAGIISGLLILPVENAMKSFNTKSPQVMADIKTVNEENNKIYRMWLNHQ